MKMTLILAMTAALAWGQAPAADPVVLTIGDEKITRSMFENIMATLSEQQRAMLESDPGAKRGLAENLAELKTMAQEGRRLKLDQASTFRTQMQLQSDQALARAVFAEMMKGGVTDMDLQTYYKEHAAEYTQAKGRHILIRFQGSPVPVREGQKDLTDEQALARTKELQAKLNAGAKFADVAKAESDDAGSGANGGELGTFRPGEMVPAFDKIAFEIPVGKVSDPVKSEFGYHLILIEERGAKPFAEVRETIEKAIGPEMGQKAVEALKAKTKVVYDEGFFGKADAPPAPAN
jgi:peptidyl-prolyl cis-trans isomerase C